MRTWLRGAFNLESSRVFQYRDDGCLDCRFADSVIRIHAEETGIGEDLRGSGRGTISGCGTGFWFRPVDEEFPLRGKLSPALRCHDTTPLK